MQLKHQEELGKRLKMNINTEKKLIKEVSQVKSVTIVVAVVVFVVNTEKDLIKVSKVKNTCVCPKHKVR